MINPIAYTESVVSEFLKYQASTYRFADNNLYEQLLQLLQLGQARKSPLLKGPYVSLSRAFLQGAALHDLVDEGILHSVVAERAGHPHLYKHQENAIRSAHAGNTTLVSTGTGSGKTEAFLYPIVSHCLNLRDQNAPEGIAAVIVYPMNALAEDQMDRLRDFLAGTGITFGLYVGKTPDRGPSGRVLSQGASRAQYRAELKKHYDAGDETRVFPHEERVTRQQMRENPPRILLTNVKQLELLLTRQLDAELFAGARLDYLVFDEAHTFTGAGGAETAVLIRRLRDYCGKDGDSTVSIATSATLADPDRGPDAAAEFASRFFGVSESKVQLIAEEVEDDAPLWGAANRRLRPLENASGVLGDALSALGALEQAPQDAEARRHLLAAARKLIGQSLRETAWEQSLYDTLVETAELPALAKELVHPRPLADLTRALSEKLRRDVNESEVLLWLALSSAARNEGRPLLRPVVHSFVKGVGGAVVTFSGTEHAPRLWLTRRDAEESADYALPVLTCTTCGQHYYEHYVQDFAFLAKKHDTPKGGQASGNATIWEPLGSPEGGNRVVMVDSLIGGVEVQEANEAKLADKGSSVYLCTQCGTLHSVAVDICVTCGREHTLKDLTAVPLSDKQPDKLGSCLSCGKSLSGLGGIPREPIRPLRAYTAADVHVLAQSMLQHAERERLLVFTDNRQDAAFQAGWMKDHARRFRLMELIYAELQDADLSVGDLVYRLDQYFEQNRADSQNLLVEVWNVADADNAPKQHLEERKLYLHLQVLREITRSMRESVGLEVWGRVKVRYGGLAPDTDFISRWSDELGLLPETLLAGIENYLDTLRRGRNVLFDPTTRAYSRFWRDGDREIQRGYWPTMYGSPSGLKLQRDPGDSEKHVSQLLSPKGLTLPRSMARKWGVLRDREEEFVQELWDFLTTDTHILKPVTFRTRGGKPFDGAQGAHQVDAEKLEVYASSGTYQCSQCRRTYNHPAPHDNCIAWQCKGALASKEEDPNDYNLVMLDQDVTLLKPREHSGQVPSSERERLEEGFKSDQKWVNTLVCTPTLELGVDIGNIDAILMRNVPPLPSNYWQRVGRAGRRHRMAVDITYARPASHDQAYFQDPAKMLEGLISPPAFNLSNQVMIEKHVHSIVLSTLHRIAREEPQVDGAQPNEISDVLERIFPGQIKTYLFDEHGYVRNNVYDISDFRLLLERYRTELENAVSAVYAQTWPEQDRSVVSPEMLQKLVAETPNRLEGVLRALKQRLDWALFELEKLRRKQASQGTLEGLDESLYRRLDRYVKLMKGQTKQTPSAGEGIDDLNTMGVLAAEGYLPGYGLETGSVVATHLAQSYAKDRRDFTLRRSTAMALRELVPGNLIYANGSRYVPRSYQLQQRDVQVFSIDPSSEAVSEVGNSAGPYQALSAHDLAAVPISDVNLPHQSHISDDEPFRYQMPVATYGYEQNRHGVGKAYRWGTQPVLFRKSVHFRLVNAGPASKVRDGQFGYPLCLGCGQTRSPYASDEEITKFWEDHEQRCGVQRQNFGFHADIVADALTLPEMESRTAGYSLVESLRQGAARVLQMDVEDLQVLAFGTAGDPDTVTMVLYDVMPGGSGLLEQMLDRWSEVLAQARVLVADCPSACDSACVDCLLMFRNAFYHRYMNRHTALELIDQLAMNVQEEHEIPAQHPSSSTGAQPVNNPEARLKGMLLAAGFGEPEPQRKIDGLGPPHYQTQPDFFYPDPDNEEPGVCIYLDGMSKRLHGNPATAQKDREIRSTLKAMDYRVIGITVTELDDRDAMAQKFKSLARYLVGNKEAKEIAQDTSWFDEDVSNKG